MVEQPFMDKRGETDSVFDSRMAQFTESGKQFDKLLTKKEFHEGCDKIKRGQRKILALATHILEQERAETNSRIDRVEDDIETNKSEINKVKTKLAMDA
jgi:hypothetical protein